MIRLRSIVALVALNALGCANVNSIDRRTDLGSIWGAFTEDRNSAVHLDIKQRVVLAKGGGDVVCAEPSPDALSAFASAASGGAAAQGYGSAAVAAALSEAASSVGLRTQSITLMRDALYRICEAYYNSELTEADVKLLLTRSQDLTATVVSIEQLTGAVVAQHAALGGSTSAASSAAMVANAEALAQILEVEKKRKDEYDAAVAKRNALELERAELQAQAESEKDPGLKQKLEARVKVKSEEVSKAEEQEKLKAEQLAAITKAREAMALKQDSSIAMASAGTTSSALLFGGPVVDQLDKDTAAAISTAVSSIVQYALSKSYAPDQCMHLLSSYHKAEMEPELWEMCIKLVANVARLEQERTDSLMRALQAIPPDPKPAAAPGSHAPPARAPRRSRAPRRPASAHQASKGTDTRQGARTPPGRTRATR
jgi:hypothetical protein